VPAHSPSASVSALMRRTGKVCGVAVIEGSGLAWSSVTGGAPGALFQAGSIAKPVTALAALEPAARGQADLDADVNEQLTSWHLPGKHAVSLRQLLGHTAGAGVPFFPGYPQGGAIPTLEYGWTGFRQPQWKRLHGLPGIRKLT
jgi:CubicO group peptidase (beta-lactamase class C family)